MDSTSHTTSSVGVSTLAGMLFAVCDTCGDPFLLSVVWVAVPIGAVVGFVLSPAAIWARADPDCRPSFSWVVVPTAALTFLAAATGDAWTGFLASVLTYNISCVIVGLVAIPRRRRLNWYIDVRCSNCGYDVRGLDGPKCPECGEVARVRPRVRVPLDMLRDSRG